MRLETGVSYEWSILRDFVYNSGQDQDARSKEGLAYELLIGDMRLGDDQEESGGEELEMIEVSKKSFR